jgi:glutathione S-transferase
MRTSTVLRWIHIGIGLVLSYYFMFKPDDGWSDGFENFVATVVISLVAWTGIIKWQLPRIRRWRRRWQARGATEGAVQTADAET